MCLVNLSLRLLLVFIVLLLLNCESPTKYERDNPFDSKGANYQIPATPTLNDPGEFEISNTSYTLNWNCEERAKSYTIEESTNSSFNDATSISVNDTTKNFNHSVEYPKTYYYRIMANNGDYNSEWSNTVDIIITPPIPDSPIIDEIIVDNNYVTINWDDVNYATSYTLEEANNSVFSDANSYELGNITSYIFLYDLGKATTFYYRVKAQGISGSSEWSNTVNLYFVPEPPLTPVLIEPMVEVSSGKDYTISWNDVGASSYTIEEAINEYFNDSIINIINITELIFNHSVLEKSKFFYRVKASNKAGDSYWSNTLVVIIHNPIDYLGLTMVSIPSGSFDMGSNYYTIHEKPVHTVSLDAFDMSVTEITQLQYETVMGENPSTFKYDNKLPVEWVTWYDAVMFCNLLSDLAGLERCYSEDNWECDFLKNGFRLPTEAEWEYACRANSTTMYYTGNSEIDLARAGWYWGNSGREPHIVGHKEPTEWGLYDMHGNVSEWCYDWFSSAYYQIGSMTNPTGPHRSGAYPSQNSPGDMKVFRGGSYHCEDATSCRSSARGCYPPYLKKAGFRIVRNSMP